MYLSLFLGTIPRFTIRSILNVWKTIAISKQVEKRSYFTTLFKNTEVELQTTKLENWTSKVEKNIFDVLCLPASTNLKSELMFFDMLQLVIQERGFYPRVLNPKLPELIELNGYPTRIISVRKCRACCPKFVTGLNVRFTTISSHLFANYTIYMNIFNETEV